MSSESPPLELVHQRANGGSNCVVVMGLTRREKERDLEREKEAVRRKGESRGGQERRREVMTAWEGTRWKGLPKRAEGERESRARKKGEGEKECGLGWPTWKAPIRGFLIFFFQFSIFSP